MKKTKHLSSEMRIKQVELLLKEYPRASYAEMGRWLGLSRERVRQLMNTIMSLERKNENK